jgi:uncharacterized protein YndB with AHSA1/START domain
MTTANDRTTWSLDREIVLTRVIDAPIEAVYAAWTTPDIGRWFGPDGFTCTTHEMEVTVGGRWRFDFVGPDGTLYTNRVVYREIVPGQRLVFDHGSDIDDDPDRFVVTVTFDQQQNGKTVLALRQLHASPGHRAAAIGFGAVEYGYQTLGKLAAHLAGS